MTKYFERSMVHSAILGLMSVSFFPAIQVFAIQGNAVQTKASSIATSTATTTVRPTVATQADQQAAPKRMTPELLWKLQRLGESSVAPDGSVIAFTARSYVLSENKGVSDLHLMDLDAEVDATVLSGWPSIEAPQWIGSEDDFTLYFLGVHPDDEAGESQVYTWKVGQDQPKKITSIEGGLANLKVAPTGKHLAYTIDVKMDATVNEVYEDLPLADARIIDSLMFRHWNAWHDYAYSHLHVAAIGEDGMIGEGTDVMAGMRADCPVPPFAGSEHFNWAPDGKEIAYTTKISPKMAESTDSDVYLVKIDNLTVSNCITDGQDGYDNDPVYSPDGKYLAYHSMMRPGFESDRNRIMIFDRQTGSVRDLTIGLDQAATGSIWLPDSSGMIFNSDYRGTVQLFKIMLNSRGATQVTKGQADFHVASVMPDGKHLLATKNDMIRAAEFAIVDLETSEDQILSHLNDAVFAGLELPSVQARFVEGTDGKQIHSWVIYPPGFDEKSDKTYPMLTYCQGGPQGQISQFFSYRWNFHLMAANGYVVLAPNRRGLPGFGRQWNDQISGDWGGQAMKDLLSTTDSMLTEKYIDKNRVGAIGASFGGYSVYWLMGNAEDRFSAMIAHCGVFNMESMYASTEELFFVNWDLGGAYWKSDDIRQKYEMFSPNRFINNWKTPLLVIHGDKDFRVPINQGIEAFTTAQIEEVPSRFLYFPNEGHWVQKPQNGVLWHRVFFQWLDEHCGTDSQ